MNRYKDYELINTREAARLLSVSRAFLERDRWAGPTIPFIRIGGGKKGAVRYERSVLIDYLESCRVNPKPQPDTFCKEGEIVPTMTESIAGANAALGGIGSAE